MTEGRPKILLVDDHAENLVALEAVLGDLDVELIAVTNGNDALKAALQHDFALALLDIQMPGMDGYELAALLKSNNRTSAIPFIFISAVFTDSDYVFKAYEKGAFSFITKPFQPEILVYKVRFFVRKYEQERALQRLNRELDGKNKELESLNKELESFSYSVSHDLRTPLRAINGYAQMLQEDCSKQLDEEGKRYLSVIRQNTRHMGQLIDALLEFSRLGKKAMQKSTVEMENLVREVIPDIVKDRTPAISVNIGHLHPAFADARLIRQVFINLLSNAVKYSSKVEAPVIDINSRRIDDMTIYEVKDNGVGFDSEYKDKLFGIFQRLHGTSEFEGTGVGLALVKRIINKHGGDVWAEGEVGKGAVFYFSLPAE